MDDRDIKMYPNFHKFCTDERGLGITPYPRQLALATQLLSEYCPKCSAKAVGNVERVPKDASPESIERNFTFLEHGVCPECGARKSELFDEGLLNLYDEMDLVLGQRSGKALAYNTPICTDDGWKTMQSIEVGDAVFDIKGDVTGVIAVSDIMYNRKCVRMGFGDGSYIVCDEEHQWVTVFDGVRGIHTADEIRNTLKHPNGELRHKVPKNMMPIDIVEVRPVFSVPVKCIQTGARTYMCGQGMIPTHNSALLGNMLAPYLLHRWLKTSRPQQTMGLLRSMPLVGTLCAQTFAKAQELLFQPFLDTVSTSPWFLEYHKVLDHYQEKHGHPLYKVGANAIRYGHRGFSSILPGPTSGRCEAPRACFPCSTR